MSVGSQYNFTTSTPLIPIILGYNSPEEYTSTTTLNLAAFIK
jgi:hypothetical protein